MRIWKQQDFPRSRNKLYNIPSFFFFGAWFFGISHRMCTACTKSQFDYGCEWKTPSFMIFVHIYTLNAMIYCVGRQQNHQETEQHEAKQVKVFQQHASFSLVTHTPKYQIPNISIQKTKIRQIPFHFFIQHFSSDSILYHRFRSSTKRNEVKETIQRIFYSSHSLESSIFDTHHQNHISIGE